MGPGARSKFGVPMFEPEVFRKQMYCIEKALMTLLGAMAQCPPPCASSGDTVFVVLSLTSRSGSIYL